MIMRLLALLMLLSVPAAVGWAQTPPPGRVHRCYRLSVTPWQPAVGADSNYYRVPAVVELFGDSGQIGGGALRPSIAYPYHGDFPGMPRWTRGARSLILAWSNGFAVTTIELRSSGNGWSGMATAASDARPLPPPPLPRARVTAQRVPCDAKG